MQPSLNSNTSAISALQAYRADIAYTVQLSHEEESELIKQARLGNIQAREALIENCQPYICKVATKLAWGYRNAYDAYLDVLDIVQEGNIRMLERIDVALVAPNPCAHIRISAWGAMLNYCKSNVSSIRTPLTRGVVAHQVVSLDAPLHDNDDVTLLDLLASV